MEEMIKSIVFLIMGAAILIFGIVAAAGIEVIAFGAIITAFSLGCLIYDIVKKKKTK